MARWKRDRPFTQWEAEELLARSLDEAEAAVDDYREALDEAAKAEAAYRRAKALAYFRAPTSSKTDTGREHYAQGDVKVSELLAERERTKATVAASAELCRVRRAAIEACRTLVTSARAAETGRG